MYGYKCGYVFIDGMRFHSFHGVMEQERLTGNDYTVSVRAGYRYGGDSVIPSFASVGAGVKLFGVHLDAAYLIASGDSPLKNTFCIGIGYSF